MRYAHLPKLGPMKHVTYFCPTSIEASNYSNYPQLVRKSRDGYLWASAYSSKTLAVNVKYYYDSTTEF